MRGCTPQKYVNVPSSLNVKLKVFVASMRPLSTLPSPLVRLGLGPGVRDAVGLGLAPPAGLAVGTGVGGGVPVVTVWLTVSSLVHVIVVPLTTSIVAG